MARLQIREALRRAMQEEMRRDPGIFLMGEEVAHYNGAYKVSQGMLDEFGPDRVVDTPISEGGFAGLGIGAAMAGMRLPIESHPLQALVSEPLKPVLDTVIMSNAVHGYISQSDKGELVIGAGIDAYTGYGQRGILRASPPRANRPESDNRITLFRRHGPTGRARPESYARSPGESPDAVPGGASCHAGNEADASRLSIEEARCKAPCPTRSSRNKSSNKSTRLRRVIDGRWQSSLTLSKHTSTWATFWESKAGSITPWQATSVPWQSIPTSPRHTPIWVTP